MSVVVQGRAQFFSLWHTLPQWRCFPLAQDPQSQVSFPVDSLWLVVVCPSTYKSGHVTPTCFLSGNDCIVWQPTCHVMFVSNAWSAVFLLCRIRSFLRPANAGLTAAEALTAPFFTYDQDQGFFLDAWSRSLSSLPTGSGGASWMTNATYYEQLLHIEYVSALLVSGVRIRWLVSE